VRNKGYRYDLAILGLLAISALIFFWPVTLGGQTMVPADNVFAWEPWRSYAEEAGVETPQNSLLTDLYLENYVWKQLIVESLQNGELPLWNPYILTGVPFLAAGQHSAMYPLSLVFYLLPLSSAYGWFAAIHLFLAGVFTYTLARSLRTSRVGGLIAGLSFMFCGFMVTRNVFPMVIAAGVWLPLVLAMIEIIVRRFEEGPAGALRWIPPTVVGSVALGMVLLAGHPEMYYYVAIAAALFALWRIVGLGRRSRRWKPALGATGALLGMAAIGIGLGAAQWLPLLDVVRDNFREGSVTLSDVLGWAYPPRRVISLLIPDFFGNPSHHRYLDISSWETVPVTMNALGERIDTIYWGIKNYVEGAAYVGILPLLLALVAILRCKGRRVWFFALLALVALLLAFGSPLYWLVYHLPGLNQVHSPFRWVYLYSLSVAVLAGMGVDALLDGMETGAGRRRWRDRLAIKMLPVLASVAGAIVIVALRVSLLFGEEMATLGDRAIQELARAPEAFADGAMFYSYQFRNLLIFGLALLAAGLVLLLSRRMRRRPVWAALASLVVCGELFVVGRGFLPAINPDLVEYRTPAIDFLAQDNDLFRITSYVGGGEKTFNANAGMLYGFSDIRGYDSIIPRQYVEYMVLISEQTELPYNRIAPLFETHPEALDSALLDLLNCKYVLTTRERTIDRPGYELVYDGEIRIYENSDYLPRAFLAGRAQAIADSEERSAALTSFDPRETVILEEPASRAYESGTDSSGTVNQIIYTPNEVTVAVTVSEPALLVLGDAYADGWVAHVRPAGSDEDDEQALHILRANGNFRAVELPAGEHLVRFKYSPDPVKFGLYGTFVAGMGVLLVIGLWIWLRIAGTRAETDASRRVTRNTVTPIVLSLVNKAIDMVYAMLWLRILGPSDAGQYGFAIAIIAWFDILTNFGLNTFITREVARDRSQSNRLLSNASVLRMILCAAAVPVLAILFWIRGATTPIDPQTVLAIWLFCVALVPSNLSSGLSAVFMGHERMEIPAFVSTVTTLVKVAAGGLVLVAGGNYAGLAGISIGVNIVTLLILYGLVRALLFRPRLQIDWSFQRRMLRESYPLMINNLLSTLFFKVAIFLLEWLVVDDRALGWYNTAYKYIDAVGVIPAYFTMAVFPLMSRYAADSKESLLKAYRLSTKLLVMVAIPLTVIGWSLSDLLIAVLGGSQYLPEAANILRVMIWYMPVGFVNSVTQYVLIALGRQRFLTRAFLIGFAFSLLANLLLIPTVGYMASAYITVIAEIVLFIPFCVGIRRHLSPINWGALLWRHAASAVPVVLSAIVLPASWRPAGLVIGLLLYIAGLAGLGALDPQERAILGRAIPVDSLRLRMSKLLGRIVDRSTHQA